MGFYGGLIGKLMGFYGDLIGINGIFHGISWDIPSGKLRVFYGKSP